MSPIGWGGRPDGTKNFSLAFTYDCIAWSNEPPPYNYVSTFHYDEEEHMRQQEWLWLN